jgi:3-isopropylmalate/(R)-2-methylmalate dehydratase small subunit
VLNRPQYRDASILLARRNFGCGSSREHAPWALGQHGFRALISPGFADIFFENCFKNGLLPIVLAEPQMDLLFEHAGAAGGLRLAIDLERQTVACADGRFSFDFDIDPFRKYCLLNGYDDIALTLRKADRIGAFEQTHLRAHPWLLKTFEEASDGQ